MEDRLFAVYVGGERGARKAAAKGWRSWTRLGRAPQSRFLRKDACVVLVASIEEVARAEAGYRVGGVVAPGLRASTSVTRLQREVPELPPGGRVVLSTTNGTRLIQAPRGAQAILAGAFVNAHAVADELAGGVYGARVAVLGCGWEGRRSGEDESAAGAILHRLQDKGAKLEEWAKGIVGLYFARPKKSLRQSSAARRLSASVMRRTSLLSR